MNRIIKVGLWLFFCSWLVIAGFEQYLMAYHNMNLHQWLYPHLYSGPFDKKMFPCKKSKRQAYQKTVLVGFEKMKQLRLVIGGLARDCEENLVLMAQRLEETGALLKDYAI